MRSHPDLKTKYHVSVLVRKIFCMVGRLRLELSLLVERRFYRAVAVHPTIRPKLAESKGVEPSRLITVARFSRPCAPSDATLHLGDECEIRTRGSGLTRNS